MIAPSLGGDSGTPDPGLSAEIADPIDTVVEMGRTVIKCKHGPNTWCSCKVRDLAIRMVEAGWSAPSGASVPVDEEGQ